MNDTVIKGTGNSRSIKSVPNIAALAPTYADLLALLTGEGLPVDIGALNELGLEVHGTDLTKANLLTDATAALYGKGNTATPNEILAAISALITSLLNSELKIQTGSYSGNGSESKSISCSFTPKFFLITSGKLATSTAPIVSCFGAYQSPYCFLIAHGYSAIYSGSEAVSCSWRSSSLYVGTYSVNNSGMNYYYVLIG